MKPAQLKLIQALADLAIPLLGYFFWNWSFYFILLFFVMDYLISCVFSFIKVKRINTYQNIHSRFPAKNALLTFVLVPLSLLAAFPAFLLVDPAFDIVRETWAFLTYTEMGIPQGVVLLPLLVYGGYTQYKMQFLMPGRFTTIQPAEIWKMHFLTIFLVMAVSGLFLGLSLLIVFPSIVYIMTLIFGVVIYRFLYSRS